MKTQVYQLKHHFGVPWTIFVSACFNLESNPFIYIFLIIHPGCNSSIFSYVLVTQHELTYISKTLLSWWILLRLSNTGFPSLMSASKSLAIFNTSCNWVGLFSLSFCSLKPLYFLNSSINLSIKGYRKLLAYKINTCFK